MKSMTDPLLLLATTDYYLVWVLFLYSFNASFAIIWIFVLLPILDIVPTFYSKDTLSIIVQIGLVFQRSAKYEGPAAH